MAKAETCSERGPPSVARPKLSRAESSAPKAKMVGKDGGQRHRTLSNTQALSNTLGIDLDETLGRLAPEHPGQTHQQMTRATAFDIAANAERLTETSQGISAVAGDQVNKLLGNTSQGPNNIHISINNIHQP